MRSIKLIRTARWVFLAALAGFAAVASSQDSAIVTAPPVAAVAPNTANLTDAQLQTLLAPVALYPDALIAQILPASTYPLQVVTASRWLTANPNPTEAAIDAQNLEPSVKALLHYPTVLAMMNNQLDWTQSLGVAFLNQQADVMNAIQDLRQQARTAGSLQSNPQQQVITDDDDVEIIPVNPDVCYLPIYDPATIYNDNYGVGITFGAGCPEGLWLGNSVDWHHRWIAGGQGWHHGWANPIADPRDVWDPPLTKPWERNPAQPLPVRTRAVVPQAPRGAAPGYEDPKARTVAPGAFQGYQSKTVVQRQVNRAEQNRPAAPAPRPAAPAPRPAPQARPVQRAAPPQVFHAQAGGPAVAAQSARGNASRSASGGGGGRRK